MNSARDEHRSTSAASTIAYLPGGSPASSYHAVSSPMVEQEDIEMEDNNEVFSGRSLPSNITLPRAETNGDSKIMLPIHKMPKFQQFKAWEADGFLFEPGTRYSSVEHYLSAFKNALKPINRPIEVTWKMFIMPYVIPYNLEAWWCEQSILTCESWEEVRNTFISMFGNEDEVNEIKYLLYDYKMTGNQSINNYTNKFLSLMHKAQLNKTDSDDVAKLYLYRLLAIMMYGLNLHYANFQNKKYVGKDHVWAVVTTTNNKES